MRDMAIIIYLKCITINLNLILDYNVNTHSFGQHGMSGMTKQNILKSISTISFLQVTSHRTTFVLNKQTKQIQTSHLIYNATKITELQATLPNFVVFHSYNSFSFQVENPRVGFSCSASHTHKTSNGSGQALVSRPTLCHLQWITTYIGLRILQLYKHKTMHFSSPH